MIEEAQKRFGHLSGVEFTVGSMRKLPFPSSTFDGLLCLGALEYVPKQQREPCLREMTRVVKSNGILIFSFLNKNSPYWQWVEHGFPLMRFAYRNAKALVKNSARIKLKDCSAETMPTLKFGMAENIRVLRSLGLSIVGNTYYSLNLVPPPLENKLAAQSVWVSSKLARLGSNPLLGWLGQAFIIAAKKTQPTERQSAQQAADSSSSAPKETSIHEAISGG
jgi:SAM-dependent methyltransferase